MTPDQLNELLKQNNEKTNDSVKDLATKLSEIHSKVMNESKDPTFAGKLDKDEEHYKKILEIESIIKKRFKDFGSAVYSQFEEVKNVIKDTMNALVLGQSALLVDVKEHVTKESHFVVDKITKNQKDITQKERESRVDDIRKSDQKVIDSITGKFDDIGKNLDSSKDTLECIENTKTTFGKLKDYIGKKFTNIKEFMFEDLGGLIFNKKRMEWFSDKFETIGDSFKKLKKWFTVKGLTQMIIGFIMSPVGLLLSTIAAGVATVAAMYEPVKKFYDEWSALGFKEAFTNVAEKITDNIINPLKEWFRENFPFGEQIAAVHDYLVDGLSDMLVGLYKREYMDPYEHRYGIKIDALYELAATSADMKKLEDEYKQLLQKDKEGVLSEEEKERMNQISTQFGSMSKDIANWRLEQKRTLEIDRQLLETRENFISQLEGMKSERLYLNANAKTVNGERVSISEEESLKLLEEQSIQIKQVVKDIESKYQIDVKNKDFYTIADINAITTYLRYGKDFDADNVPINEATKKLIRDLIPELPQGHHKLNVGISAAQEAHRAREISYTRRLGEQEVALLRSRFINDESYKKLLSFNDSMKGVNFEDKEEMANAMRLYSEKIANNMNSLNEKYGTSWQPDLQNFMPNVYTLLQTPVNNNFDMIDEEKIPSIPSYTPNVSEMEYTEPVRNQDADNQQVESDKESNKKLNEVSKSTEEMKNGQGQMLDLLNSILKTVSNMKIVNNGNGRLQVVPNVGNSNGMSNMVHLEPSN